MKFVVDTQLPPRLATWLRAKGHEAIHVEEAGLHEAEDPDVLRFAIKSGAILITKDRDFVGFPQRARPIQIVWIRIGNAINRVLLARLDAEWAAVEAALQGGVPVVEVR